MLLGSIMVCLSHKISDTLPDSGLEGGLCRTRSSLGLLVDFGTDDRIDSQHCGKPCRIQFQSLAGNPCFKARLHHLQYELPQWRLLSNLRQWQEGSHSGQTEVESDLWPVRMGRRRLLKWHDSQSVQLCCDYVAIKRAVPLIERKQSKATGFHECASISPFAICLDQQVSPAHVRCQLAHAPFAAAPRVPMDPLRKFLS